MQIPITIKSNGQAQPMGDKPSTEVFLESGVKLEGITSITWQIDAGGEANASLTFCPVALEAKGKVWVADVISDLIRAMPKAQRPWLFGIINERIKDDESTN